MSQRAELVTAQDPAGEREAVTFGRSVLSDSPEIRASADGLIIESEYYWLVMFSFPPDVLKVLSKAAVADTPTHHQGVFTWR